MPLAAGDGFDQPFAPRGPTTKAGKIGLESSFIQKDELIRIDLILTTTPIPPLSCYVRTILLGRPHTVVVQVPYRREEPAMFEATPDEPDRERPLPPQPPAASAQP